MGTRTLMMTLKAPTPLLTHLPNPLYPLQLPLPHSSKPRDLLEDTKLSKQASLGWPILYIIKETLDVEYEYVLSSREHRVVLFQQLRGSPSSAARVK